MAASSYASNIFWLLRQLTDEAKGAEMCTVSIHRQFMLAVKQGKAKYLDDKWYKKLSIQEIRALMALASLSKIDANMDELTAKKDQDRYDKMCNRAADICDNVLHTIKYLDENYPELKEEDR
jgi:hypothetical protein